MNSGAPCSHCWRAECVVMLFIFSDSHWLRKCHHPLCPMATLAKWVYVTCPFAETYQLVRQMCIPSSLKSLAWEVVLPVEVIATAVLLLSSESKVRWHGVCHLSYHLSLQYPLSHCLHFLMGSIALHLNLPEVMTTCALPGRQSDKLSSLLSYSPTLIS